MQLLRTKSVNDSRQSTLKPHLKLFDLISLGIGAIIGAGIFVISGVAAATQAGPAIMLSYILAGLACAFTAFCYAELSSAIGGSGSAYGYAYAGLGECFAWLVGWCLILEYSVAVSAVAIGWSGYINNIFIDFGWHLPQAFIHGPTEGGIINLPAVAVIIAIGTLLCFGIKEAARLNNIIVIIKFAVIALFIGIAGFNVHPQNWHPFLPFGWHGVTQGAALVFFAYIGFDAVATAAEEAINPQRDLPRGIIGSLIICALLYVIISALLTGIVPYDTLNVAAPVADSLLHLGHRLAAGTVACGALAGLTTVILVMFYGLTRVLYAIARDGLLPNMFYQTNAKTGSPIRIIIFSGIIMALIAGFMPVVKVAELMNMGTLCAFVVVCIGVIIMRHRQPNMKRPFRVPFYPISPILGAGLCFYLMLNLSKETWLNFLIWIIAGLIVYFAYSYHHSHLNKVNTVKN